MRSRPSPSRARRARGLGRLAAGLLAAWLCAGAGAAFAAPPAIGSSFNGLLDLGDAQVPLPAGEWVLAGRGYDVVADMTDAAYGAIETLVLFRLDERKVTAFATLQHNLIPIETGWGVAADCMRTDMPLRVFFDGGDEGHSRCGFAGEVATGPGLDTPAFWQSALAYAANQNLALPQLWTMAGVRMSNRRDVVDIRFYFGPELTAGLAKAGVAQPVAESGGSSWLRFIPGWAEPGKPPRPSAPVMTVLDDWLQGLQYLVYLGFNRQLAGVPAPAMPSAAATEDPGAVIRAQQQQRLDALKAAHVVGNQFYAQRSAAIRDSEVAVAPEQLSALEVTVLKTAADQATTIVENAVVNLVVLGSLTQAFALLPIQTLADTLQFTTHEYAWNKLGPNRVRESPTIDFVEVGKVIP
jgi:hypothetical protein